MATPFPPRAFTGAQRTNERLPGMMRPFGAMGGGPSPVGSPQANGPPQFSWGAGGPAFAAPGLGGGGALSGGIMGGRPIPADVQAALDGMSPRDRGIANLFLTGQLPDDTSAVTPTAPAPQSPGVGGGGGSVPQMPDNSGGDDGGGGFPGMGLISLLGGGGLNMGLLDAVMNMRNGGGGGSRVQQPQQAEPTPGPANTMPTFLEQLQMSRRGMPPGGSGFPFGGFG